MSKILLTNRKEYNVDSNMETISKELETARDCDYQFIGIIDDGVKKLIRIDMIEEIVEDEASVEKYQYKDSKITFKITEDDLIGIKKSINELAEKISMASKQLINNLDTETKYLKREKAE